MKCKAPLYKQNSCWGNGRKLDVRVIHRNGPLYVQIHSFAKENSRYKRLHSISLTLLEFLNIPFNKWYPNAIEISHTVPVPEQDPGKNIQQFFRLDNGKRVVTIDVEAYSLPENLRNEEKGTSECTSSNSDAPTVVVVDSTANEKSTTFPATTTITRQVYQNNDEDEDVWVNKYQMQVLNEAEWNFLGNTASEISSQFYF